MSVDNFNDLNIPGFSTVGTVERSVDGGTFLWTFLNPEGTSGFDDAPRSFAQGIESPALATPLDGVALAFLSADNKSGPFMVTLEFDDDGDGNYGDDFLFNSIDVQHFIGSQDVEIEFLLGGSSAASAITVNPDSVIEDLGPSGGVTVDQIKFTSVDFDASRDSAPKSEPFDSGFRVDNLDYEALGGNDTQDGGNDTQDGGNDTQDGGDNEENLPPNALDDAYLIDEDDVLSGEDVLANDTDPEDDALTVVSVDGNPANVGSVITLASGASLQVVGNGNFVYNPNGAFDDLAPGEFDEEQFTYSITDGSFGPLRFGNAADKFTASLWDSGKGRDSDGNVLVGIRNPEDEPITVKWFQKSFGDAEGSFEVPADGFYVVPVPGMPDVGSYEFKACDKDDNVIGTAGRHTINSESVVSEGFEPGGAAQVTDTATVTITITGSNDAVMAVDDTETTDEDTGVTFNVLTNDVDIDAGTLTAGSVDTSTLQGSLTFNGDGSFTYDPDGQFEDLDDGETAQDVFTYTVGDGQGGFDTAQVTITINGISDAPPNLQVDVQPWDNPVLNGNLEGDDNLGTSLGEGLGEGFVFEGSGNAQIAGTGLGDEITGGPDNDRLSGGNGDDIINGEAGIDRLAGGNGNDVLNGGENNDVLYGNNGDDQLIGGPGADLLDGGAGNDILTGNEGADLFIYDGRGDDVITDFMVGEDELQLPVGADPEVEVTDAGTVLTFDDPLGSLTLAGVIVDLDML